LASYWDTLGWVEFADGNLDKAARYVVAGWQLDQHAEVADHLGQIYAKQGDKDKSTYFYAMALNARDPDPETRGRLSAVLGGDEKVDGVVEKYRNELQKLQTVKLGNILQGSAGTAQFFILLSAGTNSNAHVEGVKFVSGDERLKGATDGLRTAKYEQSFPNGTPVQILRRGTVTCAATSAECTFLLALPEDVSSVD